MVKLDELMNLDMEDDILYLTTTRDGWVPVGGEIVGTITAYFSSIAFRMLGQPTTDAEIPDEANAVLFSPLEEIASTDKGVKFQATLYQVGLPEYKLASETLAADKMTT
jgi:hypothetical protein